MGLKHECSTSEHETAASPRLAAERLRSHRDALVARYIAAMRAAVEAARELPDPDVADSLPALLGVLLRRLESGDETSGREQLTQLAREHAWQREGIPGFPVEGVLNEYRILRRLILEELRASAPYCARAEDVVCDCLEKSMAEVAREYLAKSFAHERSVSAALTEARDELERKVAELEAVLENVPEAIYLGNNEGITRCNRQALDQLGYDSTAEMRSRIGELSRQIQNRDPETRRPLETDELPFVRALQGVPCVRESLVTHLKTGEERIIRGSASPLRRGERIIGAVAINVDVTRERKRELEIARLYKTVSEALAGREETVARLEEEKLLRENFVSTLTHDLRTPLTAAKVSADLLLRNPPPEERRRRLLHRILLNVERMDAMIRDLLDANRLRAGHPVPLEFESVALRELLSAELEELATVHGERFNLAPGEEIVGRWSRDALRRILENLCGNAVKYGSPHRPITVSAVQQGADAILTVHNEGNPLSEEMQRDLFSPFHRTREASASGKRGWGIGLALVRGLTEAQGGTVEVSSSARTGTDFRIRLPLQPPIAEG